MHCPELRELPRPSHAHLGWPWDTTSESITGRDLPRITVITPSFNQAEYLEETLRSVLLQGYPDLEYLVVDGGSTDGSVEILRRYEPWLSWWCSEQDAGQADALNKALRHATGRIFNWVNSDDRLEPGALALVSGLFTSETDAVAGACRFVYEPGGQVEIVRNRGLGARRLIAGAEDVTLCQPSLWLLTDGVREVGAFNVESHYYFDAELFIRYLARWPRVRYVADTLSTFRVHPRSKTGSQPDGFRREYVRALRRLVAQAPTASARRQAANRLQQLKLHCRFLHVSREASRRGRIEAGLRLAVASLHPLLVRVSLRWMLSLIGVLRPPVGDVAELREIGTWCEMQAPQHPQG